MNKVKETLSKQIDNEKIKKIVLYLLAFLFPIILLIGIFIYLKIYPFGENTYLPVDAYGQYVNYLQYFRNFLYGEGSIFYSLSKSLGGEMYGLFAYYLMSPYNFIVLLFEKGNISLVFDIILILKVATSSVTFTYYLNRRKKANFGNLIFAMMYSFSSYVVTYGFNIMWLDAVILLPIVIAGIDDLVENKKFILYTVALSLTLITNYYIGFMVCIFSAIYFIYKILIGELKDKKNILKKVGRFLSASIIAVMITAIILVPVFLGLTNGRANFSFTDMSLDKNFNIENLLTKFYTNSFDLDEIKNEAMPPIFCGVLANILVLAYFFNSKIKLKEEIISLVVLIIFILSFYIKGINLLWSMENIPAWYIYRYTFCFAFFYILLAKKGFDNTKEGMTLWKIITIAIIYIIITIITINLDVKCLSQDSAKIDIVLAILFIILLCLSKLKFKERKEKT